MLPVAVGQSWRAMAPDLLVALAAGVLVAGVVALVAAIARRRVPAVFLAVWIASALLLATMGAAGAQRGWWVIVAVVLVAVPLVAGSLGALSALGTRAPGGARTPPTVGHHREASAARRPLVPAAVVGAVLVLTLAAFLGWPGPSGPPGAREGAVGMTGASGAAGSTGTAKPTGAAASFAQVGQRGDHAVTTFTYGSRGGAGVDVPTAAVDASALLPDWPAALSQAWGFDATRLPLQATVWRPAGDGPFPLVVVAHGNAPVGSSELGFDYLGETLASRGYVVASIDANVLNTGVLASAPADAEAARAWLVRAHLRQWQAWSDDASAPKQVRRADLGAVALVGHSRGGEAVAAAASMGQGSTSTGGPGAQIDLRSVDIRSVIAIAPSDGLFRPAGPPVELTGVDYLTLAGSYDADVLTFAGASQYARTTPPKGRIKAAVALDRMNHAQFNSRWGRHDGALGLAAHVLGTAVLVEPEQQRAAALGLISGFLDLTLKDEKALVSLFDGSLAAVPAGGGDVTARRQFAAGGATALKSTGTSGTADAANLPSRTGTSTIPVTRLRGDGEVTRAFAIPRGALTREGAVRLDLADASLQRAPGAVAIALRIEDTAGKSVTVPLGADGRLAGALPGRFTKAAALMPTAQREPVLSTYTVPARAMTGIDPRAVATVTLIVTDPGADGVYVGPVTVGPLS